MRTMRSISSYHTRQGQMQIDDRGKEILPVLHSTRTRSLRAMYSCACLSQAVSCTSTRMLASKQRIYIQNMHAPLHVEYFTEKLLVYALLCQLCV